MQAEFHQARASRIDQRGWQAKTADGVAFTRGQLWSIERGMASGAIRSTAHQQPASAGQKLVILVRCKLPRLESLKDIGVIHLRKKLQIVSIHQSIVRQLQECGCVLVFIARSAGWVEQKPAHRLQRRQQQVPSDRCAEATRTPVPVRSGSS